MKKIGNFVLPDTYRKPYKVETLPDQGREVFTSPLLNVIPKKPLPSAVFNSPIPKFIMPSQVGPVINPFNPIVTKQNPNSIQYAPILPNNNKGVKQLLEIGSKFPENVAAGTATALGGIADGLKTIDNVILGATKANPNNPLSKSLQTAVDFWDKEKVNNAQLGSSNDKFVQGVGNTVQAVTNMGPSIAATAAGAPVGVGLGLLAFSKGGNAANEAKQQYNATPLQQLNIMGTQAASEIITEYLPFKYFGKIAKTGLGGVMANGINQASKTVGAQALKDWAANTAINVVQEVAVSPIDKITKNAILGTNEKVFSLEQAKQDASGALAVSAIFAALGLPSSLKSNQMASEIVNTGSVPTQNQVNQIVEQIKIDSGIDVTSEIAKTEIDGTQADQGNGKKEISDYIDYSVNWKRELPKQPNKLDLGIEIEKSLADTVMNISGIDLSGYRHSLVDNEVRHIIKSHGELTNEKYPVTKDDLLKIPEIIKSYDRVYQGVPTREGNFTIMYEKRYNGKTYYLEYAAEDDKTLNGKQMIKVSSGSNPKFLKNKRLISGVNAENQPTQHVRNAIDQSNNSIPLNSELVNSPIEPGFVSNTTQPTQNAFKDDLSPLSPGSITNSNNSTEDNQSSTEATGNGSNLIKDNINNLYTKYEVDEKTKQKIDSLVENIMTVEDIDSAITQIEQMEKRLNLLPMNLQLFAEVKQELKAEGKRLAKDVLNLQNINDVDIQVLKDPSGAYLYSTDIFRAFKKAFGKNYNIIKEKVLDPFDKSKLDKANFEKEMLNKLDNNIVSKYNIKKGSKESAAIQMYGEGRLTKQQLKERFPKSWENIISADAWFRTQYDQLIDEINEARQSIYPSVQANIKSIKGRIQDKYELAKRKQTAYDDIINSKKEKIKALEVERAFGKLDSIRHREIQLRIDNLNASLTSQNMQDKLNSIKRTKDEARELADLVNSQSLWRGKVIPKRKDYYRHFNELSGISGLANIFSTPSQIDPKLAGISEYTAPKSKFLSLAQKRGNGAFKDDAVGGFIQYLQAASYSKYIDPQIDKFRLLQRYLEDSTADTKNMGNMVGYLKDYADDLAGKTNPADRYLQKYIPGGRMTFKMIDWINSRTKANVILGNISSSLSQIANVPQGIATVKNPVHLIKGFGNSIASYLDKGDARLYNKSSFLSERYSDKNYKKFDERILEQPKKFAGFMLEATDEIGTKFIWSSVYSKAKAEGINNPIKYADEVTRSLVAGRGVGEVPLIQKSKVFQAFAPFTLEVGNLWKVQKDFVNKKDIGGLLMLFIGNYILNNAMKEIRGSGVTFDPIEAILDAIDIFNDDDKNTAEKVAGGLGRIAGEVISNIPLGSTLASIYPEYGKVTGIETDADGNSKTTRTPTRKELFGDSDPTRFGPGLISRKALEDPFTMLALPFGGNQVKKTYKGLRDLGVFPRVSREKGKITPKLLSQPFPANYSYTSDGKKLNTPINPTPLTIGKAVLFGNSAIPEVKNYYENGKSLSPKQTKLFENLVMNYDYDIMELYDAFVKMKSVSKKEEKHQVLVDSGYSETEATFIIKRLYEKEQ